MSKSHTGLILAALLASPLTGGAAEPAESPALADACLECHRDGGSAAIPGRPSLRTMSRQDIAARLRGYRESQVPESRMTDVTHNFSDEEIRRLAKHYGKP